MQHRLAGASVLAVLALVLTAACSDPAARPPVTGDGSFQPGVSAGGAAAGAAALVPVAAASDAGPACNDFDLAGDQSVDQLGALDNVPPGQGGTLESASYVLTNAVIYGSGGSGGPTGLSVRGELELAVSGGTGTFRRLIDIGASGQNRVETRDSGTLTVSSNSAVLTVQCPVLSQEQVTFTATGTTLVMTNLTSRQSYTFTKR
jgi:hypothetical protein